MWRRLQPPRWLVSVMIVTLLLMGCAGSISHSNATPHETVSVTTLPIPVETETPLPADTPTPSITPSPTAAAAPGNATTSTPPPIPTAIPTPPFLPPAPTAAPTPLPANWSQPFYGAEHNSANPLESQIGTANVGTLSAAWTSSGMDFSFVIDQGLVFALHPSYSSDSSIVFDDIVALDARSGRVDWTMRPPANKFFNTVAAGGGFLYVSAEDTYLYALDERTGAFRWSMPIGTLVAAPTYADGSVYVATASVLFNLRARDGAILWHFNNPVNPCYPNDYRCLNAPLNAFSSPSVSGSTVLIGAFNGGRENRLFALDAVSGTVRWSMVTVPSLTIPVAAGEAIYQSDGTNLYAISIKDGGLRWVAASTFVGMPAVAGDRVYAIDAFSSPALKKLRAFDTVNGRLHWSTDVRGSFCQTPAIANGVIYLACFDGWLYAYRATDGGLIWYNRVFTGSILSPQVVNGMVYCWGANVGGIGAMNTFGAIASFRLP